MRRLLLAPVCLLVACVGASPARRPVAPAEPVPVASERQGGAEEIADEAVASALVATVEAARVAAGAASGPRLSHLGLAGTPSGAAALIVERAVQLVGVKRLERGVPDDCSGLVRLAYQKAGIDLVNHGFLAGENAVTAIFRRAEGRGAVHHRRPRPGDLAFFRETYDRNRDGLRNDGLTHIAVVESVERDGTVTFIHRGSKGIARSRMNLLFPRTHRAGEGGPVLNDFLRAATRGQRAWLTGELFVSFASPGAM